MVGGTATGVGHLLALLAGVLLAARSRYRIALFGAQAGRLPSLRHRAVVGCGVRKQRWCAQATDRRVSHGRLA